VASVLTIAVVFPFVMAALAPAVATVIHRAAPAPGSTHPSVLAEPIEKLWRETTDKPLHIFSSFDEFTDGVTFYMRSHPLAVHVLDGRASPALEERIERDGIALLCPARGSGADWCANTATARARCAPAGKQAEIELSRSYLGMEGTRARYLVITIAPRRCDTPGNAMPAHCHGVRA